MMIVAVIMGGHYADMIPMVPCGILTNVADFITTG